MLKGVVSFGLTHRPMVLMGLFVFVTGGLAAFFQLNIEAYPNPAPVILEITAQAPGLSAEEMELALHPRGDQNYEVCRKRLNSEWRRAAPVSADNQ